jgi:hypothetical protein
MFKDKEFIFGDIAIVCFITVATLALISMVVVAVIELAK